MMLESTIMGTYEKETRVQHSNGVRWRSITTIILAAIALVAFCASLSSSSSSSSSSLSLPTEQLAPNIKAFSSRFSNLKSDVSAHHKPCHETDNESSDENSRLGSGEKVKVIKTDDYQHHDHDHDHKEQQEQKEQQQVEQARKRDDTENKKDEKSSTKSESTASSTNSETKSASKTSSTSKASETTSSKTKKDSSTSTNSEPTSSSSSTSTSKPTPAYDQPGVRFVFVLFGVIFLNMVAICIHHIYQKVTRSQNLYRNFEDEKSPF
ncbi:hypothetical protein PVL30_002756 [Lodderomyces elongisporus]|uniref:uncharacterized protein n=1 Tax=Lodderomyces elongisporus TaxID=36914 RepID=UPI00291D0EDA|nr:uncharacterized protein PVL30_002756 [Lodderomyces elongisporus]WLF79007.1 hypothetical protein PVL30_002756 [Lodderomyces elongisporus]